MPQRMTAPAPQDFRIARLRADNNLGWQVDPPGGFFFIRVLPGASRTDRVGLYPHCHERSPRYLEDVAVSNFQGVDGTSEDFAKYVEMVGATYNALRFYQKYNRLPASQREMSLMKGFAKAVAEIKGIDLDLDLDNPDVQHAILEKMEGETGE